MACSASARVTMVYGQLWCEKRNGVPSLSVCSARILKMVPTGWLSLIVDEHSTFSSVESSCPASGRALTE